MRLIASWGRMFLIVRGGRNGGGRAGRSVIDMKRGESKGRGYISSVN